MILYHGSKEVFNSLKDPSPLKPFFLSENAKYASHYSDGHTLQTLQESENGYVYVIDIDMKKIKYFDFSKNSQDFKKLDVPLLIENIFKATIPIKAVNSFMKTISLFSQYDIFKTNLDPQLVKNNLENLFQIWSLQSTSSLENLPIFSKSRTLTFWIHLVETIIQFFKIKNFHLNEIRKFPNKPFSNRSFLYQVFAKLIVNEIYQKGFNCIYTIEGSAALNIFNVKCYGLLDKSSINGISIKLHNVNELN